MIFNLRYWLLSALLLASAEGAAAQENYDSVFYSTTCANTTITFGSALFDSIPFPEYIMWNFGDPALGIYNTAQAQQPTVDYTTPGKYYVTLQVVNSGDTGDTVTLKDSITVVTPMAYNFGPDIYLCGQQDTLLQAPIVAGATYRWNDDSSTTTDTLLVTQSGVYTVAINGCWVADSIGVFIDDSPNLNLGANHVMCDTDNVVLNVSTANGQYTWTLNGTPLAYNGGQLLTSPPGGLYKVVEVVPGCGVFQDSVSITYFQPSRPPFTIGPDTTLCPGAIDTLVAHLPGANAFAWSTGSTDSTTIINQPGTYYVFATYHDSCQVTDSVLITYLTVAGLDFRDTAICQGAFLQLNADFGTGTYTWTADPPQRNDQNQSGQATYYVYNPGTYMVSAQVGQCVWKDTIKVTYDDSLKVYLSPDTSICNGADFHLHVVGNGDTYIWQDSTTGPTFAVQQAGTYTCIVENGCKTDTLVSNVTFGECACNLVMPDAFTPNGDGHNDLFKPLNFCSMSYYRLLIFDRYGDMVYSSGNPEEGWDGTVDGRDVPVGNYVWEVRYTNAQSGQVMYKKGNVVVMR